MSAGFRFSAGEKVEIEVGRSGKFTDMNKQVIDLTPDVLANVASTFDAASEAPVKIGHGPIDTATPDYGTVEGLRYDRAKDRLMATIVPTPITVTKNRTEGFKRVSMELVKTARGFALTAVSLLGARRPAIGGLAPVSLSGSEYEMVEAGNVPLEAVMAAECGELPAGYTYDDEGSARYLAAREVQKAELAKGNEIDFETALRQAATGGYVSEGAYACDPASVNRMLAAQQEQERAAAQGQPIDFVEALKRIS